MTTCCWFCGASAVLHDVRFDAEERMATIAAENVNVLCMAPTEYRVIARRMELSPIASLRECVSAGEALNAEIFKNWRDGLGAFDLILCNPPYVEEDAALDPSVKDYEPAGALFAGADGLGDFRALVPQLPALLVPGGVAVLEIGHNQADAVSAIAATAGFSTELRRDLAGRPRALILRQG